MKTDKILKVNRLGSLLEVINLQNNLREGIFRNKRDVKQYTDGIIFQMMFGSDNYMPVHKRIDKIIKQVSKDRYQIETEKGNLELRYLSII